jgi:hypothetical protein
VCIDNGLVDKVVLKEKENLNYWSAKWEENTPLEPTGAKKLQSMAIRATSKKRKRDKTNDNDDNENIEN